MLFTNNPNRRMKMFRSFMQIMVKLKDSILTKHYFKVASIP